MGDWSFIILFGILLMFSVYIGFLAGQGICERFVVTTRDYWLANGVGVLVAILLVALLAALPMLYAVAFGGLPGYIAGLKLSFGESVGPWKALDRFFKTDKRRRAVAAPGSREASRRRRKEGAPAPDLISVEDPGASLPASGSPEGAGSRKAPAARRQAKQKKGAR